VAGRRTSEEVVIGAPWAATEHIVGTDRHKLK
jgi:hypothetical protein